MADHRVRVILEAVNKGGDNVRRFFADNSKEVEKFRKTLRAGNDELGIFLDAQGKARTAKGAFVSKDQIGEVETAILKVRELRKEMDASFRGSKVGQVFSGFAEGRGELAAVRAAIKERIELSKEGVRLEREVIEQERFKLRQKLDEEHFKERALLEETVVTDRKIRDAARIREQRDLANYHSDRIRVLRQLAVKENTIAYEASIKAERQQEKAHRDEIIRIEQQRDAFIKARREGLSVQQQTGRREFDIETRRQVRGVTAPDIGEIVTKAREDFQKLNAEIEQSEGRLARFGRSAGRSMNQLALGLSLGRRELSAADREFIKTESRLTRLGVAFSQATRGARQFVNVRWAVVIGFLQIFLTLVIQLGVALVALASSAIQAGAALGGALLAGLSQLVPVVALLGFALKDLGQVLDALKLDEKLQLTKANDQKDRMDAISDATDRLRDSRQALIRAGEAVKDSEYDLVQAGIAVKDAIKDQKDAIDNLADARQQAARDIVDANLEEKEAALNLADAELAVLDARRKLREESERAKLGDQNIDDAKAQVQEAQARLAQARAEGDTAEITVALQQLNQAEQSLQQVSAGAEEAKNNAKQAQIDVKQAELNQQQAIVRNKRAQEDAAKARKDGVEGSDRVVRAQEQLADATRNIARAERQQVLAQRAVRDAIHGLAAAKRDERKATEDLAESQTKQTAQQQQLQEQLADMSPAQRRLFNSLKKFRKVFEDNFGPITDIITNAFARAVDKAVVIIQDPAIIRASRKLATAIGGSIDALADFAISPEFRRFLTFTINNAAKNVPKITDAFIDLFRVLMRISTAATPLFNRLIDRFQKFAERLEERTRNPQKIEKFFAVAGRHLDAWLRFGGAVARILGLVIKLSAPSGESMIGGLTDQLNEWSDWLDNNETKVLDFFTNVSATVGSLAGSLALVGKVLFEAFTSEEAGELSQFILETIIPAFATFLGLLGVVAGVLNTLFGLPLIGRAAKFAIQGLLVVGFMHKLLPVTRKLTAAFWALTKAIFSGQALAALKNWIQLMKAFIAVARTQGILVALSAVFPKLAAGIRLVGAALKFVFITNPWIAVLVGIIAAVVLLDRKFHFIRPTIEFLGKLFQRIFNWVKKNWKLLAAIFLAPFAVVIFGVIKFHDKIIGFFKGIIEFVKKHWKLLVAILLAPFAIGGTIILAIIRWREKIFNFFKEMPGRIVGFFKKLPSLLMEIFKKIPGLLKDALSGLKDIVTDALAEIPIVGRFFGNAKITEKDKLKIQNQVLADSKLDPQRKKIKALRAEGLKPDAILQALLASGDLTEAELRKLLEKYAEQNLAVGGTVSGAAGKAVPIIAHAGEWVVNKVQQAKIAKRLGMSAQQAAMWLFGTGGRGPDNYPNNPRTGKSGSKKQQSFSFGSVRLVSAIDEGSTDAQGNPMRIWFVEMDDGTHGQVSERDAARIQKSNGTWVPGYVKRSSHGFTNIVRKIPRRGSAGGGSRVGSMALGGIVQAFANGGVIQNYAGPMLQSFADGGTVLQQSGFGAPGVSDNRKVEQNFQVTANHDADWNYILRLGAIQAQAAYT